MRIVETWGKMDVYGTTVAVGDIFEDSASGARVIRYSGVFGTRTSDHESLEEASVYLVGLGYSKVPYESEEDMAMYRLTALFADGGYRCEIAGKENR